MRHAMRAGLRLATPGILLVGIWAAMTPTWAETTPASPASSQPSLPHSLDTSVDVSRPTLDVHRRASVPRLRRRHVVRREARGEREIEVERPALAGVALVGPLPPPNEPPGYVVPTPAYPLENIAATLTTPLPPIVCHHTARDPYAPDPRFYRERAVQCEPDTP